MSGIIPSSKTIRLIFRNEASSKYTRKTLPLGFGFVGWWHEGSGAYWFAEGI